MEDDDPSQSDLSTAKPPTTAAKMTGQKKQDPNNGTTNDKKSVKGVKYELDFGGISNLAESAEEKEEEEEGEEEEDRDDDAKKKTNNTGKNFSKSNTTPTSSRNPSRGQKVASSPLPSSRPTKKRRTELENGWSKDSEVSEKDLSSQLRFLESIFVPDLARIMLDNYVAFSS